MGTDFIAVQAIPTSQGASVVQAHAHLLVRSLPRRRKDETHGDAEFGQH